MPEQQDQDELNDELFTDKPGDQAGPLDDPSTPDEPASEKLLRIQLRNGKIYTGKTERELLQQLVQAQENADVHIKDREEQIREMRGKVQHVQVNQPQSGAWDAQKYLDLLGSDPMEARRYQDQHYYGLQDGENAAEMFKFSYELSDRVADTIAVTEFHRANPDFPGGQEASVALLKRVEDEGLALNPRNLASCYRDMVREGAIQPNSPSPQQGSEEFEDLQFNEVKVVQPKPQSRGKQAAPAPRSAGNPGSSTTTDYENMPMSDLEKLVKGNGMKKF